LFKVYPNSDAIKVLWIIPARELWGQYGEGKITENSLVYESIFNFLNCKEKLEEPEKDDLSDEQIRAIYRQSIKGSYGQKD
jgi:hypothetical protein